jgi:hypothetical protein
MSRILLNDLTSYLKFDLGDEFVFSLANCVYTQSWTLITQLSKFLG